MASRPPPVVHSAEEWAQFAAVRQSNERHIAADIPGAAFSPFDIVGGSGASRSDMHWAEGVSGLTLKSKQVTPVDSTVQNPRAAAASTIQYVEAGPTDSKMALLMVHGWGESWRVWQRALQAQYESNGFRQRTIAVDLRGFGGSSPGDRVSALHGVGYHVDDLVALMDSLRIERVCIVAHSLSSLIALRMALEHTTRVASIMLFSGGASFNSNPEVQEWKAHLESLNEEGSVARADTEPVTQSFVDAFFGSRMLTKASVPRYVMDTLRHELRSVKRAVLRQNINSILEHRDLLSELCHISVPFTVVRGAEDTICTAEVAQQLVDEIPHATVQVVPESSSLLPIEQPKRVASLIQAFSYLNEEHFIQGYDEIYGPYTNNHLQTRLAVANMSSECFLANADYDGAFSFGSSSPIKN